MDLSAFADEVGVEGPVTIAGLGTRGGPVPDVRLVRAPAGIDWIQPDEMTVSCGAGTSVDELHAALAGHGQRTVLPDGGTVGGALAVGRSGVRRLGDGPVRDALLQTTYVGADGGLVKAGGPTVKNVSGFDVCRLLVGAQGTLGFFGEVILRTRPIAPHSQWFTVETDEPLAVFTAVHRPVCALWDGRCVRVLLEGHPLDVDEQATRLALRAAEGPPPFPAARFLVSPSELLDMTSSLDPGSFVAELGLGIVHAPDGAIAIADAQPGIDAISRRVKANFDPTGRLNPGRAV